MYKFKVIFIMAILFSNPAVSKNHEKTIVIGERIIDKNPWRNDLVKKQYEVALSQALKEHKLRHPGSTVKLVQSFDNGPTDGFALAEKVGALGVAGYLYSPESLEASQLAQAKKIPYLAPASPLNSISNDFAYSLAASHNDLKRSLSTLRKRFDHPSIVLVPETFLTNLEYARIYEQTFNVIKTYRGTTSQIWQELSGTLPTLTEKEEVNILFAGFAFEQLELVQLVSSKAYANKVNLIGHVQWNYCEPQLEAHLSTSVNNFYVFSDYFNPEKLAAFGFPVSVETVNAFKELRNVVNNEPAVKGNSIDEPIIYVLKDMIAIALNAAEISQNRDEFNKKYSSQNYVGTASSYHIVAKKPERKVYLGKWDGKSIQPLTTL